MIRSILFFLLGMCMFASPVRAQYDKLSPFDSLRWKGESPEVQVENTWYGLVSINDIPVSEILDYCKSAYRSRWDKRFCEDLVQAMSEMGKPPEREVKLVVTNLGTGKKKTLSKVRMTADRRNRLRDAQPRVGEAERTVNRIDRTHRKSQDKKFGFLTQRYWEKAKDVPRLTATQAKEDLDELEWKLTHEFSYLKMKGVDFKAAFDTLRLGLGKDIATYDFHIQLRKLVALFGDGHSRVRGIASILPPGFASFRVVDVDGKLMALHPKKEELLEESFPIIAALDGKPIDLWLQAASRLAAQGSPQWIRRESVFYLSWVDYLRQDLKLRTGRRLQVTLSSLDGSKTKKVNTALGQRPYFGGIKIGKRPQVLEGEIGYLPIDTMSLKEHELEDLDDAMMKFKETKGLIIDVRGNGGGNRDALRLLFPYFMADNDPPYVANVAAMRLSSSIPRGNPTGYLGNRFAFPADFPGWNKSQSNAIKEFKKTFKSEWSLPKDEFSSWHYMVLDRSLNPNSYGYEKPVILLTDANCYSATDIFIGAFKGRKNVTILGGPSGGGSGRSITSPLKNSSLQVKISSMASFQPNGKLYDGNGVPPDRVTGPTLDDYLGKSDSVLEKARKILQSGT